MSSFTGNLPYSDESTERNLNAEHIQVGAVGIKRVAIFDSNGNELGGLNAPVWDYMSRSLNSATETYVFKVGGSSGTTVMTLTVVYTDTTLTTVSSITKS